MRNPYRTNRKRSTKPLSKNQQRKWHNLPAYEREEITQAAKFLATWFIEFMQDLRNNKEDNTNDI